MQIDFKKGDGLVPAIIQDAETHQVLMLGYMNEESLAKTQAEGRVTFYSRSKNRLWTKGETSGNFLNLVDIKVDCDNDTLLVKVNPVGPACHTGSDTCFDEVNQAGDFMHYLEEVILDRKANPSEQSYTASLFKKGINKIAQKVGEEAVELVIEAKDNNKDLFLNEAADLTFHLLVLLAEKGYRWEEVLDVLRARHK
jgi:phosphoribosyl-ATP pyrophosphohydrolase/phosphoribosyl-AMP cyclohydrolase